MLLRLSHLTAGKWYQYLTHQNIVGNIQKYVQNYHLDIVRKRNKRFMGKWTDVLDIGPECTERFLDSIKAPEIADLGIQIAGVSDLRGKYRVGYASPDTHTVLYTVSGQGLLHTDQGSEVIKPQTITTIPYGMGYLFELDAQHWSMAWFQLHKGRDWHVLDQDIVQTSYREQADQIYHLLSLIHHESSASLRRVSIDLLRVYLLTTLSETGNEPASNRSIELLFRDVENKLHHSWTVDEMCKKNTLLSPSFIPSMSGPVW